LTGPVAQYGLAWKKGFDLAIEEINGAGGIKGRPLQIQFTDTQNDPKQTIAVAQKYVADPKIVLATGDFSSTSSMAASAIYQRAGLVQFGFNNSNPDFSAGGDYLWSNSPNTLSEAPAQAAYVRDLGLKKVALFHLNTDWGKSTSDATVAALKKFGVDVALREAYLSYYMREPFVAVLGTYESPEVKGVTYTNNCQIGVSVSASGTNSIRRTNRSRAGLASIFSRIRAQYVSPPLGRPAMKSRNSGWRPAMADTASTRNSTPL